MYCKNCGAKVNDSDVFCAECGCKIKDVPIEQANVQVKKKKRKGFLIGIVLLVIIIVAVLLLAINGTDEYELTAGELAQVMNTEEEEKYYEDILHVHGLVYSHPTEDELYVLVENESDEEGVVFQYDSMPEDVGDASEVIITGTLGYGKSSPSVTILLGEEIEVVNKVEPVYFVSSIEELLSECDKYIGKTISIVGTIDGINGNSWIYDVSPDKWIRLIGDPSMYDVYDWEFATVTGVFTVDEYGEAVIEIDNIE